MSKRAVKIISILFFIGLLATSFTMVFAGAPKIPEADPSMNTQALEGIIGKVLTIVQWICYAVALIMLIMLGVKYVTASPEGQANIKTSAIQYVIGAVLIFAAGSILQVIKTMATPGGKQ